MSQTRRSPADLALPFSQLIELGRLAETAAALAAHLDDSLCISHHSNDFAEAGSVGDLRVRFWRRPPAE